MRSFFLIISAVLIFTGCNQEDKKPVVSQTPAETDTMTETAAPVTNYATTDMSPMDMIYCPSDYPLKKMAGTASALPYARIIYSRPQTQGRKIFGELVKYNQPWRMGANEATELELFSAATIQDYTIPPGRYVLFCIPSETNWTIILNSNIFSWGLSPDRKKNVFLFSVPVEKNLTITNYLTMIFENSGSDAKLLMVWDDVKVTLPIKF